MNGMPALKDSHAIPGTPSSRLKEKQTSEILYNSLIFFLSFI